MRFFKFFQKKVDNLDIYLRSIQTQILEIKEFRNFRSSYEDYQNELNEFKKFIIIFLSGSLYLSKVKQHLKINDFKGRDPIYEKVFQAIFRQVLPFYKLYVQNDKIIIGLFSNAEFKDDKTLGLDVLVRLTTYQNEIKEGLETGNPYFFDEYETEDYDEDLDYTFVGKEIYFEYLRLLFLTKIEKDEDHKLKVEEFDIIELMDNQLDDLGSFVKSISNVLQNIEIKAEMLASWNDE